MHVQGQSMITAAVFHPYAERGKLATGHIYARGARFAFRLYIQGTAHIDEGLLQQEYITFYGQSVAGEIQHQIHDQLTGPVIGSLPAAIRPDDGDIPCIQYMFLLASQSQRINSRVVQDPNLIPGA
jgi:hypothetical protein